LGPPVRVRAEALDTPAAAEVDAATALLEALGAVPLPPRVKAAAALFVGDAPACCQAST